MFRMKTLPDDLDFRGGVLRLSGDYQIDSRIESRIESSGSIVVSKQSHVIGEISARNVIIHGKVDGQVTAGEVCRLCATAEVHGSVDANHLSVEEGADFMGASKVGSYPLDFLLDEISERLVKTPEPANTETLRWVTTSSV